MTERCRSLKTKVLNRFLLLPAKIATNANCGERSILLRYLQFKPIKKREADMKNIRFLVFVLTIGTLLLSACGGTAATPPAGGGKVEAMPVAFVGTVNSITGNQWVISGTTVTVEPSGVRDGPFNVGDQVKVEGVVNADGSFTISRVEVPTPQDVASTPQFGDDNSNAANVNDDHANINDNDINDDHGTDVNVNDDHGNDTNVNDDHGDDANINDDHGNDANVNDANTNDDHGGAVSPSNSNTSDDHSGSGSNSGKDSGGKGSGGGGSDDGGNH